MIIDELRNKIVTFEDLAAYRQCKRKFVYRTLSGTSTPSESKRKILQSVIEMVTKYSVENETEPMGIRKAITTLDERFKAAGIKLEPAEDTRLKKALTNFYGKFIMPTNKTPFVLIKHASMPVGIKEHGVKLVTTVDFATIDIRTNKNTLWIINLGLYRNKSSFVNSFLRSCIVMEHFSHLGINVEILTYDPLLDEVIPCQSPGMHSEFVKLVSKNLREIALRNYEVNPGSWCNHCEFGSKCFEDINTQSFSVDMIEKQLWGD
jgi:hypothetical protein